MFAIEISMRAFAHTHGMNRRVRPRVERKADFAGRGIGSLQNGTWDGQGATDDGSPGSPGTG